MKRFVCGFFFNKSKSEVLLIEKKRPHWQLGMLNGIGGHIEKIDNERYELPLNAMIREFKEETGIQTERIDWHEFAALNVFEPQSKFEAGAQIAEVACFRHISRYGLVPEAKFQQLTDEKLVVLNLSHKTRMKLVPSLSFLLEMARDENSFWSSINYVQPNTKES
jgi:8-oxo-dGTP pyrophosphatase MutT (NUDIX family)